MQINSPLCITSRLLPGVKIGEATISIGYSNKISDGRQVYRWYIDGIQVKGEKFNFDFHYSNNNLTVDGGSLQEGLESLLSSLGVFAEEWQYRQADGTDDCIRPNCNLFPADLAEWAIENVDEIAMLELDLSEHPNQLIIE